MVFFREHTTLLALLLVLIVSVLLIWNAGQRESELRGHEAALRDALLDSAALAVEAELRRYQNQIHLFADEAGDAIARVSQARGDAGSARSWLFERLRARFPSLLTFAITDARGEPVFKADEFVADEFCRVDVRSYARDVGVLGSAARNKVFIHPRPDEYHFDVMARFSSQQGVSGLLFVSLLPDVIAETLSHYRLPGHELMLVRDSDSALIEITARGSRDRLSRSPRLLDSEVVHLADSRQIDGADWRLIDVAFKQSVESAVARVWRETTIALIGVSLLALLLLVAAWRAARARASAD